MTSPVALGAITRIGWRNLWRNRRRTVLALSAIGLAQGLVLIYDGVLGAYGDWMVATVTGPMLGHVQVHAPGWRKDRAMDKTIRNAAGVLASVRGERDVIAASGRVYAPALAAAGTEGFAVMVVGIAPEVESRPTGLLSSAVVMPGGRSILMGRRLLAEGAGVKVGDQIALVGQGVDGSLANDLYTVAALVNTPVEFSPELTVSGQWIQSPADGSGVAAPSATLTFSDRLSVLATLYVPYGSRVHDPTDVVSGVALGTAWALILAAAIALVTGWRTRRRAQPSGG